MSAVAAVVVTHGRDPALAQCLAALGPQVDELVVVANPPAPAVDARLIVNERALGLAANANKGIAATNAPFVVVANPDTTPRDGAVAMLRDFAADHPRCGIAGPLLLNPDGTWQASRRRFPTVSGTIARRTPLRWLVKPQERQRAHYLLDEAPTRPVEAEWMLGAFLLLRREMLDELGGFDEGYRLYGEDIDLCYRAARAGWERWYVPQAAVTHVHAAETDRRFLTRRTLWHWRSIGRFVRKHPERLRARYPRPPMVTVPEPATASPLQAAVELPNGLDESALREFLESVRVTDGPPDELRTYCRGDFWRFVRTYDLVRDRQGRCLELGANPYFTTMLLREFTDLELVLANYFGPSDAATGPRQDARQIEQTVVHRDRASGRMVETNLTSHPFNIEHDRFPFGDGHFDVVLFCEIIEHLTADPLAALREIKRVLRPDGVLVLTTPNVNRLENVVKMVAGSNIYDPYSGYGSYGRHNREYNKHELHLLLTYLGFEVEYLESADVQDNSTYDQMDWSRLVPLTRHLDQTDWRRLVPLIKHRERDLGQYLFLRAYNRRPARAKRPEFLFRSYPAGDLEPVLAAEVHDGA